MISYRTLFLSDDLETGRLWVHALLQRSVDAVLVGSAEEALTRWEQEAFDLLIIDSNAPQQDILEICRQLRTEIVNPILLFTYHGSEPEALAAYEAGVDECIVKPVSPPLFLAKVNAWLRRSWTVRSEALPSLQAGELQLDPATRQVLRSDGNIIKLSNLEFRLLHFLMLHQGRALESKLIVDRVWGLSGQGDNSLLKNVIYRLRRKIEPDPRHPQYLQTVAGEGYTLRSFQKGHHPEAAADRSQTPVR